MFWKKSKQAGPVGWSSLAGLLDDLGEIAVEHEEIFDSDCRENLWAYLEARFINFDKQTILPRNFGLFSDQANEKVREAFARNTKNLDAVIETFRLDTPEKRRITFTNQKLKNQMGHHIDDFFGSI